MSIEQSITAITGIAYVARPIADAAGKAANLATELVGKLCNPLAEQIGHYLGDKGREYRTNNFIGMCERIHKKILASKVPSNSKLHPRVMLEIYEKSSLTDDPDLQEMWAGLLTSSLTDDGKDQGNLFYADILRKLTPLQAKILNHACRTAEKCIVDEGLHCFDYFITIEEFYRTFGVSDPHIINRECGGLAAMNLLYTLEPGISYNLPGYVTITPNFIAIDLFLKCQGSRDEAHIYFKDSAIKISLATYKLKQIDIHSKRQSIAAGIKTTVVN